LMRERFENMLAYTANETECRSAVLQRYFGDAEAEDCGVCDICLAKRRRAKSVARGLAESAAEIIRAEPITARELCRRLKADPSAVAEAVDRMRAEGKISVEPSGKLIFIG